MFIFAGTLYLVAVACACALPKEKANAKPEDLGGGEAYAELALAEEEGSIDSADSYGSVA